MPQQTERQQAAQGLLHVYLAYLPQNPNILWIIALTLKVSDWLSAQQNRKPLLKTDSETARENQPWRFSHDFSGPHVYRRSRPYLYFIPFPTEVRAMIL